MSFLLRMLIPLVGYVCVATVVSAALGVGYLRRSGKLNDETLYRMVALVHGVDLEEIEHAQDQVLAETPREEPSYAEQQMHAQAATIHFDAKRKQLADSLLEFDFQLERLTAETNKYAELGASVEQKLKSQKEELLTAQMIEVRKQIEMMTPDTQAKEILVLMIRDQRIDEVILLLGSMKARSCQSIINTFDTKDDIDMLYLVQQKMLAGGPTVDLINERLKDLEQLKNQEQ